MPTYDVTVNGREYEVDAKDEAQAWQYAKAYDAQHNNTPEPKKIDARAQKYAEEPWYKKAYRGFANPLVEGYLGAKQLTMGLDEIEKGALEELRAANEGGGGWNTAGQIASYAVPGVAAAKLGMKAGQMLPRALAAGAPAVPLGFEMGAGAGLEALRPVLEGDPTRGERAASGAASAALGYGLGVAANRALTGLYGQTSDAARALIEDAAGQGVDLGLTAGQRAGGWANAMEGAVQNFVGNRGLAQARQDAIGNWNISEMRKVAPWMSNVEVTAREGAPVPGMGPIDKPGAEGFRQLDNIITGLYKRGSEGVEIKPTERLLDSMVNIDHGIRETADRARFEQTIEEIWRQAEGGRLSGSNIKDLEHALGLVAKRAGAQGDIAMAEAYRGLRDAIRRERDLAAGPTKAGMLREADAAYGRMMDIAGAVETVGAQRAGVFSPDQLQRGVRVGQTTKQKARGVDQEAPTAAREVFGTRLPEVGPGTAEKLAAYATGGMGLATMNPAYLGAYALPLTIGQMRRADEFLTGGHDWQQYLRRHQILPGAGSAWGFTDDEDKP